MFEGLLGLAGIMAESGANASATALNWQNLQFQRENARRQYGLASAGRTDAFGNETSFDDLMKKWITTLTPMQSRIVKAGEREQLSSLTEDAGRNRNVRRAQAARAGEAKTDYEQARSDYRYDQPPEEEAIRGELASLLATTGEADAKRDQGLLIRQALRLGRGGDVAGIVKATNDQVGEGTQARMLKARQGALAESMARDQAHDSKYLGRMGHFASMMDAVGAAPQRFSETPAAMRGDQAQMLASIMAALNNESGQVGGAYNTLANRVAASAPDFSQLAGLFSGFGQGGGSGGSARAAPPQQYSVGWPNPQPVSEARFRSYDNDF